MLDESAHVYKAILLDENARPITRHQIWLTSVVGYNNAIPAGRSDIARFPFPLAIELEDRRLQQSHPQSGGELSSFNQEFTKLCIVPTRKNFRDSDRRDGHSRSEDHFHQGEADQATRKSIGQDSLSLEQQARRWNDYGIALVEQAQYGPAAEAFRRAGELNPKDLNPLISAAVAEMRTERFGPDRQSIAQSRRTARWSLKARSDSTHGQDISTHCCCAAKGKPSEAAAELAKLAQEYPQ